jgi:3-oxoadipate enol-lactonase / 4-carboxymuconolactone decarboxylase
MPFALINAHRCHYRLHGHDGREVVVLSHCLGLDHGLWDALTRDLVPHVAVLRYDTRGHGVSEPTPGDYSVEQLSADVLALTDALDIRTFAFCGLSLGGMIGQWLGVHAADRVTRLVLANTSPRVEEPQAMEDRRRTVLERGMPAVESRVMDRFFSPRMRASGDPSVDWARRTLLGTDAVGYAGCCAAIRDFDFMSRLGQVAIPTLVISGDVDVSMPWDHHGRLLSALIPRARDVRLSAAHVSNLERPRAFAAAVLDWIVPVPTDVSAAGTAMRRTVLGDAHVDRARDGTTDFTRDFQELITRYTWGTIWTRPALDRRTRRLLVIATTAVMGRWEEFRLHVRTGLAADLDATDLKEVLLQVAVYGGVPAANTAFHIASEELKKTD